VATSPQPRWSVAAITLCFEGCLCRVFEQWKGAARVIALLGPPKIESNDQWFGVYSLHKRVRVSLSNRGHVIHVCCWMHDPRFCHLSLKFLNPARFKVRVSGFNRVDWVNFYFKKIQNGVVLVKKVNGLQPGFDRVTGLARWVTPSHDLCYFFINPARFQPRVDPPGRTGFQNTACHSHMSYWVRWSLTPLLFWFVVAFFICFLFEIFFSYVKN